MRNDLKRIDMHDWKESVLERPKWKKAVKKIEESKKDYFLLGKAT